MSGYARLNLDPGCLSALGRSRRLRDAFRTAAVSAKRFATATAQSRCRAAFPLAIAGRGAGSSLGAEAAKGLGIGARATFEPQRTPA